MSLSMSSQQYVQWRGEIHYWSLTLALQTMAVAAVMTVNLFNGLNTAAWTGWVYFAVFIGIILVWAYTVCFSAL